MNTTRPQSLSTFLLVALIMLTALFALRRVNQVMVKRFEDGSWRYGSITSCQPGAICDTSKFTPAYWEDGTCGPVISCDEDGEMKGCSPGNPLP